MSSQWASLGLTTFKHPSCTTKFCFCFFPTAGNWLKALKRGMELLSLSLLKKSIFCSCTVGVFFFFVSYGCFLVFLFWGFLTAAVTVASGFSAASGCLLGYFLIKSHVVFLTQSAVEITSWSQAPSDHPRRHFKGIFIPLPSLSFYFLPYWAYCSF